LALLASNTLDGLNRLPRSRTRWATRSIVMSPSPRARAPKQGRIARTLRQPSDIGSASWPNNAAARGAQRSAGPHRRQGRTSSLRCGRSTLTPAPVRPHQHPSSRRRRTDLL